MATPYMNLNLPVVSVTLGPTWASQVNAAFTQIDAHNHTSGNGQPVPSSALSVIGDIAMVDHNVSQARSIRFFPQTSPLSGPSDVDACYTAGVDLYYNDGNGNQIRLTASGAPAGTPGSIGGLVSPASVTYNAGLQTFSFTQDSNRYAAILGGNLTIFGQTVGANGVTIVAPATLAASYTVTLPIALPAATKLVTLSSGGQLAAVTDVDNTSIEVSSNNLRVKAAGVQGSMLNANVVDNASLQLSANVLSVKALGVTNAMLAGSITDSKFAALTITGASIANTTITDAKMVGLTLTGASIANGTITDGKLAALTLTAASIANNTITDAKMVGLTLTGASIANNTITDGKLAALTITSASIANNTITATQIANATITTTQISGTAGITGGQIAATTIAAANIVNNTITAAKIANATITTTQISATAGITGGQIAATTVAGSNIVNNTITDTQVNFITNIHIAPGARNAAAVSNTSAGTGVDVEVASLTLLTTALQHPVIVTFSGMCAPIGTTNSLTIKIKIDGVTAQSWSKGFPDSWASPSTCTWLDLAPTAGFHIYSMSINATSAATNMNTTGTFYAVEI